jgi:hypothetical protein
MIGFLKKLAVALLRSSGRPELVAMADWINDAGDAAVALIVRLLGKSVRSGEAISAETAQQIVDLKQASQPGGASRDPDRDRWPFLMEYLELMREIAMVGSWRRGLVLGGFLHSSAVSSLWVFDFPKEPDVRLTGIPGYDASIVMNGDRNFEVFIMPPLDDAALIAINKKLGGPANKIPDTLDRSRRVEEIYEGKVVIKSATGTQDFDIEDPHEGSGEMIRTFPIALQARSVLLNQLQDLKK